MRPVVNVLALLGFLLLIGGPLIVVGLLVRARRRVVPSTRDVRAGWYGDPVGGHKLRYWDGDEWTDRVADAGVTAEDPLTTDGS
jgi:hypothetical protein